MEHELSDWISEKLKEKGWSVREFGRRIGVSPSHASRVVNGHVTPSFRLCNEIARAFSVRPQKVLVLAGLIPPEPAEVAGEKRMLHLYRELPAEDRQDAMAYMEFRHRRHQREQFKDDLRSSTAEALPPMTLPNGQLLTKDALINAIQMRVTGDDSLDEEAQDAVIDALVYIAEHAKQLRKKRQEEEE
jgi:transcriptional regulator with XRE-family HTH domain